MEHGTLNFAQPGDGKVAAVFVVLALLLLLWSYYRSPLRGLRRALAFGVKLLAFTVLALALLEPMWSTPVPKKLANNLVLLADNSAGLGVMDARTKQPFGAALKSTLTAQGPDTPGWMQKLEETFRVQRFLFDDRLHEAPDFSALNFSGTQSAVFGGIESALQRNHQQPLAGILLFTDGNATDEALWAKLEGQKPAAPIYPVMVGSTEPVKDLSMGEVTVTQSTFEDSPVTFTVKVSAQGFGGEELTLLVKDEAGKTVLSEKQRLAATDESVTFRPQFRPAKSGLSFYSLSVLPTSLVALQQDAAKLNAASQEVTLENNTRLVAVDRHAGPYRVLYIAGRPNWEYKFLRRALEPDEEVKLTALIRMAKREPKFEWRGRSGETSNPLFRGFKGDVPEEALRYDQPVMIRLGLTDKKELADGFPKTPEELFAAYRCIVIDDLEAAFFTHEQMDLIERYVSVRGGSLLMLGGQESFDAGGYDQTPIGRLLPVYLDKVTKAPPMEDARFNLSREGWLEPWTRLRKTEAEEQARLAAMPTFYSINQIYAIKPGASVLATVTDAHQVQRPAWISQRYGSGRVVAVTLADVWRWGLRDPATHADMDKAWRQLMRSLLIDVPDRVEVQLQRETAPGSQEMKLAVRVRDQAFRAQDDATVKAELTGPDGKTAHLSTEPSPTEPGLFETRVPRGQSGAWRIKTNVLDGEGKSIGDTTVGWSTNAMADELQHLSVNRDLLERIAKWSGGRVLRLDEVAKLANELPAKRQPVMETRTEPFWHRSWLFAAVIFLLGLEWYLRRQWTWA